MQQGVTNLSAECIINGTNLGFVGKDGICQKAGKAVQQACQEVLSQRAPLQVGDTFTTVGGALSAKHIIHVISPLYNPNAGDKNWELLTLCYQNALRVALEQGIKVLAFPTISTGLEQFPKKAAADVALNAVSAFLRDNAHDFQAIWFVCAESAEYKIYEKRWDEFLAATQAIGQ